METFFYAVGGALILIALVISFIGMRSDDFPSPGVLRAGVLAVVVLVVATAYGAVGSAQDEQAVRLAEENELAEEAEAEEVADNETSGALPAGEEEAPGPRDETDGEPQTSPDLAAGDPEAGSQVFVEQNCGSCHSLEDAGAAGVIGPNLDVELVDRDPAYIETSIVAPATEIADGFSDGIMPVDYGDVIPPDDLANLVAYLAETTSGAGTSE